MTKAHSALLSLLIFTTMTIQAMPPDKYTQFGETFRRECRDAGVVGGSFAFIKDNKIVSNAHYGLANIARNQPVDENTIFHWASNTKPLTGIALMQLRDRGMLKLDDPVTKYLPELRSIHNRFGSMDEITIRHLMTHSAGLRSGTWPWGTGESWEPFEPTEYAQVVAMLPYTSIQFKPGSKYSYSNPGIIFLGRIIEKLSGDDYEVYIDKNIFKPLEMHRSYFDGTPYHLLRDRSHSYRISKGKTTEGTFDANTGITVSNGGLNSPLSDMVKYLNFLIGDPGKKALYDGVLKRSSLEEMWIAQLPTDHRDANGNSGATTDIGLIFFLDTRIGRRHLGHTGSQNDFYSYLNFDPDKRMASIAVINTTVEVGEGRPADSLINIKLARGLNALYKD